LPALQIKLHGQRTEGPQARPGARSEARISDNDV
jgi:hypothetical protein